MKTNSYYRLVALRILIERRQAERSAKGNPSASLARALKHINTQIQEH